MDADLERFAPTNNIYYQYFINDLSVSIRVHLTKGFNFLFVHVRLPRPAGASLPVWFSIFIQLHCRL